MDRYHYPNIVFLSNIAMRETKRIENLAWKTDLFTPIDLIGLQYLGLFYSLISICGRRSRGQHETFS